MFLTANAVEEENKVGHVLSGIGATAYSGVAKLTGTDKPERQQFDNHKTEIDSALQAKTTSDQPAIYFSPTNTETK